MKGRALVVDDESGIRLLLQPALIRAGFDVETVEDGDAALALLRTHAFELVLTDKNMPGIDGVELARRARALHPGLCIVLVTGFASEQSARDSAGIVDAYLTKPFSVQDLRGKLEDLLERRRAQSDPSRAPKEPAPPLPAQVALLVSSDARLGALTAATIGLGIHLCRAAGADEIGALPEGAVLLVDGESCTTEVYRAIWRRQAKDRHFAVVLVTPPGDFHAAINAVSLGARAHLTLPATTQSLMEALRARPGAGQ